MPKTNFYLSHARMRSLRLAEDFTPDGNLTKEAWKAAPRVRFDHDWTGKRLFPQASTEVASRWSKTAIYFAFWCRYTKLNVYAGEDPGRERWELWERDVVEVFLNPQPERVHHYYEFEVSPNNQWLDLEIDLDKTPFNDASWNSGFEHQTRIDAQHHLWTCEMRIPFKNMTLQGGGIAPGMEWRLNLFRADGEGDDAHRRLLAWSPLPGAKANFHTPNRFGIIRFVN